MRLIKKFFKYMTEEVGNSKWRNYPRFFYWFAIIMGIYALVTNVEW